MADVGALAADLRAEHEAVDAMVSGIDGSDWLTPTPAAGWDVRDSIGHLNYFDETARLALTDADAFKEHVDELLSGRAGAADVHHSRSLEPQHLLERWRSSRLQLLEAVAEAEPGERVPWYGPAMSLASFVTARLMETWAHGQDVADALGLPPVVSNRLRHVIHIGVGARRYAYLVNGKEDTGTPVRVEAAAPDGTTWTWGPDDAADRVSGTALELALVLTQRRHRSDTDIVVEGPTATEWISIAQSFAGPAGTGRQPGMNRVTQG